RPIPPLPTRKPSLADPRPAAPFAPACPRSLQFNFQLVQNDSPTPSSSTRSRNESARHLVFDSFPERVRPPPHLQLVPGTSPPATFISNSYGTSSRTRYPDHTASGRIDASARALSRSDFELNSQVVPKRVQGLSTRSRRRDVSVA